MLGVGCRHAVALGFALTGCGGVGLPEARWLGNLRCFDQVL